MNNKILSSFRKLGLNNENDLDDVIIKIEKENSICHKKNMAFLFRVEGNKNDIKFLANAFLKRNNISIYNNNISSANSFLYSLVFSTFSLKETLDIVTNISLNNKTFYNLVNINYRNYIFLDIFVSNGTVNIEGEIILPSISNFFSSPELFFLVMLKDFNPNQLGNLIVIDDKSSKGPVFKRQINRLLGTINISSTNELKEFIEKHYKNLTVENETLRQELFGNKSKDIVIEFSTAEKTVKNYLYPLCILKKDQDLETLNIKVIFQEV